MFLGLYHLRAAVQKYDEDNRWSVGAGGGHVAQKLLEDLETFIDWEKVAREMEHQPYDVEPASDGGVWVFEDMS